MHGTLQRFGLLVLAIVALAAPAAAADPLEYDLTVGDAPTSGITATTVDGLTTFRSSGPQPATLAAADVNAELAAGRDVAIIDEGDYYLDGTLRVTAPLSGAGRSVSLVASQGDVDIYAVVNAGDLSIDAYYGVSGGGDVQADRTDMHAGADITLDGDGNHLGRLALRQERAEYDVRVHDAGPLTLGPTQAAGELAVLADSGLAVDGDVVSGGEALLVADYPGAGASGTGDFTATPGTRIDAGGHPITIDSAHRLPDRLGPGLTLNGASYVPGPALIDSASEVWGRNFRSAGRAVAPYRFDFLEGDFAAPTVRVDYGAPGAPYFTLGQVVPVTPVCEDTGGSGLASCVTAGLRADGTLDTGTVGHHEFRVTATDNAGHKTTFAAAYLVKPAPKVCVTPTTATFKIERPKGTRSAVATLGGKLQKVKLSRTRIVITADVRGRTPGRYALKVTIRRGHGRKAVVRRPKVIVYKCVGSHGG